MTERIRCPNPVCPQPDDVQKVSVVYESGVAQQFVGSSQTALSSKLSPPERPEAKEGAGTDEGCVQMGCLIGAGFFSLLGVGAVLVGLYRLLVLQISFWVVPANQVPLTVLGLAALILVPGAIFVFVLRAYRGGPAAHERELTQWRPLKARWEQLYYCHRCDSVFNPNEHGRFVPASRMKELLT